MAVSVVGPAPISRCRYEASVLLAVHPPRIHHSNKRAVYEAAVPPGATCRGTVAFSRWDAIDLPDVVEAVSADLVVRVAGFFDYEPVLPDAVEWHVNFADPHLFVAYGGPLFAQDEMQVAEHPALASLREALAAEGVDSRTDGPAGPTPVLVTGVERRVAIATAPDPRAGRPHGLYGNAFAAASREAVMGATRRLDPAPLSNIIAMAAIPGGWGLYRRDEIERTLVTAHTGFRAAVVEARSLAPEAPVVVHTGYWGCGAFGGDRVLMALLQILAASMAGLDRLVFHFGSRDGAPAITEAIGLVGQVVSATTSVDQVLQRLADLGFEWGIGNGT